MDLLFLHRKACISPGIHPSVQNGKAGIADRIQYQRRTGALALIGSRSVENDFLIAGKFVQVLVDLVMRH